MIFAGASLLPRGASVYNVARIGYSRYYETTRGTIMNLTHEDDLLAQAHSDNGYVEVVDLLQHAEKFIVANTGEPVATRAVVDSLVRITRNLLAEQGRLGAETKLDLAKATS